MDADERRRRRQKVEDRRQHRDFTRRQEALKSQQIARWIASFRVRAADIGEVPQPERRIVELGLRSAADPISKAWVCGECGTINAPLQLLLCDLARPVCGRVGCHGKAPRSDFNFSMSSLEMNGICPIDDVKTQGPEPHCVLFATASMAEAQHRISSVCSGIQPEDGVVMGIGDIIEKYEGARFIYDINQTNADDKWNRHTVQAMRLVAKDFGFESMAPDEKIYRFPYSATIKLSFDDICYMLAQGYPMLGVMIPGENFHLLKLGQIYKAPKIGNKHVILLIGAGRHHGVEYNHFLNSWGKEFCKAGPVGGYGLISADDILDPPTAFLRHKEDLDEHKEHLVQEQPFPLDPSVHDLLEKIGLDCFHLGGKVVEQCTSNEMGVAMSDSWVHDQKVLMVEQEGLTRHFDAAVDDTKNGVDEEQCDELRAVKDGNCVEEKKAVKQEGIIENFDDVVEHQSNNSSLKQCTSDEFGEIKDRNTLEEKEVVVEQEGSVGTLGAAENGDAVALQEEDNMVAEGQDEDDISVQDQHKVVVDQCDELGVAMGGSVVQDHEVVVLEHEGVTVYFDTVVEGQSNNSDVEQCMNDEPKAVKDGNFLEEKNAAMQEGAKDILGEAKGNGTVGSHVGEVVVVAEQGDHGIYFQDQYTAVKQFIYDRFRTATDINAAQDQGMVESIDDKSKASKDKSEKEENKVCSTEDGMSVRDQDTAVEQCTSDQVRTTMDDNAAEDQ